MELEKMNAAFDRGLNLPEGRFQPLYYLSRVDEPEFGCEGRPEAGPILGRAYGFDPQGPRQWDIGEVDLWRSGLDDGMRVGRWQGGYATLPMGTDRPRPLEPELFGRMFGTP